MSTVQQAPVFDRLSQIGDLSLRVRRALGRGWPYFLAIFGIEFAYLALSGRPGSYCFALIALGTLVILLAWKNQGIGLPLAPLIAFQHLLVYGLPIVTNHEILRSYPESVLTAAGMEVAVFSVALTLAWSMAMHILHPSSALSFAMPDLQQEGAHRLKSLGMGLILAGTAYLVLDKADLLSFLFAILPTGSTSLILPLVTGTSACGFFLMSLFVSSGQANRTQRLMFWSLLAISTAVSASGFLLSSATTMIGAVFIGTFWSTGRIPWRYLTIVVAVLSFFSVSKFTMRGMYWQFDNDQPIASGTSLTDLPRIYVEWTQASIHTLTATPEDSNLLGTAAPDKGQSLLERINNLGNMLFIIDAVENGHIPVIHGQSYSLIPPLLVPRIMWPDKPRTHAGQVLLNVHFGRQDLNSTLRTYVAWGLLPEAYGNFGRYAGSLILGAVLGFAFAWIENLTSRKLLLSLEGFVCFVVLLGVAGSYEMVASVAVTMIFQSVVPIIFAAMPFVRRIAIHRPTRNAG